MKIAIIRQRYNPFGGAERFVERALQALAADGADITLIARQWAGSPQAGVKQVICDPPYSTLLNRRIGRDRSFATAVQAIFAAGQFDITQSHERIPGCSIFRAGDGVHAAWLKHRARVLNPLQRLAQQMSPYHRYVMAAEKAMFAHPNLKAVICNSTMVRREIQAHFGLPEAKLPVIYNGVDLELFHPGVRQRFREQTRLALEIPLQAPVVLYVGSGFERKGVPRLLQAFARLNISDAQLVIVGADRQLDGAKKLAGQLGIQHRTRFLGPQKDVLPYYGMADAFALPTLYDPFPNAVLEAMACGLPCVTSTTCGAAEVIDSGRNGWVHDALDIPALSGGLRDALEISRHETGRAAARQAVEHLGIERTSKTLLDLYQSLGCYN